MKTSHTAESSQLTQYLTEVLHIHQTTDDGYYELTSYPILPGIVLAFNDIHTTTVPVTESTSLPTALSSTTAWMAAVSSAFLTTTTAMWTAA